MATDDHARIGDRRRLRPKSPVPKIRSLIHAENHMEEAKAAAEHLLRLNKDNLVLAHAISTGMVVCYTRPFMETEGVSGLSGKFTKFSKHPLMGKLHKGLMRVRNKIYAHQSPLLLPGDVLKRMRVEFSELGPDTVRVNVITPRAYFQPELLGDVIALCEFQSERMHKEWTEMVDNITQGLGLERLGERYSLNDEPPYLRRIDDGDVNTDEKTSRRS